MALRRSLTQRLYNIAKPLPSRSFTLDKSLTIPLNNAAEKPDNESSSNPSSSETGFFRRFLHRKAMNPLPEFLSLPVGDKLREKLIGMNISSANRLRLESVLPPPQNDDGVSVEHARKLLRITQVEKLKCELKRIEKETITYKEYVRVCVESCDDDEQQGLEFAKLMDVSGNVIVLGNTVFLRPDQVAKSMEALIFQSIPKPNDPRRGELEQMEKQKSIIDQKAASLVRAELYGGLGFLVLQTLGFMRLTFWELSWDVMEPICFFVTSLHFAAAYTFFLRTSTEPSFEGYFQRRFKTKQKKLMEIHNFDLDKYNELFKAFYRTNYGVNGASYERFSCSIRA